MFYPHRRILMTFRNCLTVVLCSFALCFIVQAQEETKLKLSDATTSSEVIAYLSQEMRGIAGNDPKTIYAARADLYLAAGDKILEIAQDDPEKKTEKRQGYSFKLNSFLYKNLAEVEGAEQKLEAFLKELETNDDASIRVLTWNHRLNVIGRTARTADPSPENYAAFMSELKPWVNNADISISSMTSLGRSIAEHHNVPVEQFVKELSGFVQSADALSEADKTKRMVTLDGILRLATVGTDPKLYGKTLDDKDFDWEKLRGKYVLIKFTATWCGPCQMQIPGMLETYEKYHDKGFEIISVYMWQREDDPVATVKNYVEGKKLPWVILSEELSKRAKHPEFGEFYGINGVPTFVLVDKEGKMMMPITHGDNWKAKLAEVFK